MSIVITKDFVQTTLAAPAGSGDVTLTVNSATTPFLNIPAPAAGQIGFLVLTDDLNNPTKFEIVSYTGYSSGTVSGVTRGLGGTSAQSFLAGAFVYMAPLSVNTTIPLWAINLSNGNISYTGGKVGVGTATPGKDLDVVGDVGVSGDVAANTMHVAGASTLHAVSATTVGTSGDVTAGGAVHVGTNLALPSSATLGSYKIGTWTPTLIGGSSAGTATYTTQTGNYVILGKIALLQFNIVVHWPSVPPSGQLLITGYPAGIGSVAGYAGSFSDLLGFQVFKGFTNNTVHSPTITQNVANIVPLTKADSGNLGLIIARTMWSNDQSLGTPDVSQLDLLDATYIVDTTVGITVSGSIMFQTLAEA